MLLEKIMRFWHRTALADLAPKSNLWAPKSELFGTFWALWAAFGPTLGALARQSERKEAPLGFLDENGAPQAPQSGS